MERTARKTILNLLVALITVAGIATVIALPFIQVSVTSQQRTITLQFDKENAYFVGSTPLTAISGDLPSDGDNVETATIKLTASEATLMQLRIVYDENSVDIPCLMVRVNEGEPMAVSDGVVLYTSQQKETEATLSVVFYLSKDAGAQSSQKTLSFQLELKGAENV